jgi:hypothetical protein
MEARFWCRPEFKLGGIDRMTMFNGEKHLFEIIDFGSKRGLDHHGYFKGCAQIAGSVRNQVVCGYLSSAPSRQQQQPTIFTSSGHRRRTERSTVGHSGLKTGRQLLVRQESVQTYT